ncbi:hypothetical protein AB870_15725 [Pandoraea faecigallinarum]|uniref:Uncharacterized protein n=1 Tax=Pandoraea faecigallinarum TaxID=656179 RepID=A0A0H3WST2_9BURK|nr:hypothetical protein [Pandoraea faecigallinarum]AKM31264.1 hypothetical protein AB870_15725 [Pandoraea faecigallinarum]
MAGTSRELKDREGIDSLAKLARRRETGMRAALARLTAAANEADAAAAAYERACAAQRRVWQEALSRGGIYGPREAAGASLAVEVQRMALGEAAARHRDALARARQARADLQEQRERLRQNARKQEKLRELLTLYPR